MTKHIYLESDGKLLLVYGDGTGPAIPQSGRANLNGETEVIRLPTESELSDLELVGRRSGQINSDLGKNIILWFMASL